MNEFQMNICHLLFFWLLDAFDWQNSFYSFAVASEIAFLRSCFLEGVKRKRKGAKRVEKVVVGEFSRECYASGRLRSM